MSSPDRIVLLDEAVACKIAAGEVVERPASVVKELIENSLDAAASRIEIEYADRPSLAITVTDNGRGIAPEQVELAVKRHATSKIRTLDDLTRFDTLGFRGEALASMAAVATLELATRTEADPGGVLLVVREAKVIERRAVGVRVGTRVGVSDLFARVPARRKFLKSATTEYSLAADTVRRFGLLRPDVHLALLRNGKRMLDLPAVSGLAERLRQIRGDEDAAGLVELSARHAGLLLEGAISPAGVSYGSARRVSLFVNGRWVRDRDLFRMVMDAYRTYLVRGRYPSAVLLLTIDPGAVDVNVHPAKLELRFSQPEAVRAFVVEAIRDTLRGKASPLGRWGLGERDLLTAQPRSAVARWRLRSASRPAVVERGRVVAAGAASSGPPGYRPPPAQPGSVAEASVQEQRPLGLQERGAASLEVIGQVFSGYIICQGEGELILVDQHAAHERLLFERLMEAYAKGHVEVQPLLLATTVRVGEQGVEAVQRYRGELGRLGWDIEAFGAEDVLVRSVPTLASGAGVRAAVERLASDLEAIAPAIAERRLVERVMATVACHAAVRVGARLEREAARTLLEEVASVDFSASCPHGRPVARTLSREQLERFFGR